MEVKKRIMAHNVTVTQKSGTRALLLALAVIAIILARRAACNTLKADRNARKWLTTRHDFFAADGDPIQCTGWQFIGYNIIAAVVAILLCIKY